MERFYELAGLRCKIEKTSVLKAIDCYEDSPVYEEVAEEYDELCDTIGALAKPVGILGFSTLPQALETGKYKEGTPILFMVISIGDGIGQQSTKAFAEGDYVKGMLCDAMADDALFSLEAQVLDKVKEICAKHRMGVLARLEAPHDISMEAQKTAWEELELKRRFGIGLSSGYMFDPVKTSCNIFVLTEDMAVFQAEHDCRKCPNLSCRMRNIPDSKITVIKEGNTSVIFVKERQSLLEALTEEGYFLSAPCGGRGNCGKCKVQVLEGEAYVTEEDRKVFSRDALKEGWRLSCRLYPNEDLTIRVEESREEELEILTTAEAAQKAEETAYKIAVDIGTTTIALELLGAKTGKKICETALVNKQRAYGADVISRIKASTEGKKEELQNCIRKDLRDGIDRLLAKANAAAAQVQEIIISANTTMGHLLMGYDCSTLGVYPFTPVDIDFITGTAEEILGMKGISARVVLLPGISAFVGADIVSGLYACDVYEKEELSLLVDLGTNGEMALGNKEKLLVTSTAAGPAFEGGNISCGVASIPGAVCSVKIEDGKARTETIRQEPAIGLCGTGVIETVAELVRNRLVDESGLLEEAYFEDGYPVAVTKEGKALTFTQKDVREIQLAKAAVRAGIETLLLRYGVSKEQVSHVYVAGGFGCRLDAGKAVAIGMLPKEFAEKVSAVGNSSLAGAAKYARDSNAKAWIQNLTGSAEEVSLSADRVFQECYMDAMMFEDEEE